MDMTRYWADVNAVAATLPADTWLMSLENRRIGTKAGAVVCASPKLAAQRIVEQTHRLATKTEVEAFKAGQDARLKMAHARDQKRAPKTVLVVGAEQYNELLPKETVERVVKTAPKAAN